MKFDVSRHGRGGMTGGSEHLQDRWARVGELPGPPPAGEWVPAEAVWIADGVSPRQWDPETAERYAQAYLDLPPITVQRDTFALIDGRHRLEAMRLASFDWVRIIEVDVPAERLAAEAFLANVQHGRAYTTAERIGGLRVLWQADKDKGPVELAKLTGLDRHTVSKHLDRWAPRPTKPVADPQNNPSSSESAMAKSAIGERRSDSSPVRPGTVPAVRFADEYADPYADDEGVLATAQRTEEAPPVATPYDLLVTPELREQIVTSMVVLCSTGLTPAQAWADIREHAGDRKLAERSVDLSLDWLAALRVEMRRAG